jgi:hypothetical protein
MARYTLRTLSRYYASPAEVLRAVNETLVDQMPEGRFCSIACGAFGPSPHGVRATVVVAGHPKPLLLRRGEGIELCGETGLPLGIVNRLDLPEVDVVLEPGDSFLMVTDGCVGEGAAWEGVLHAALEASPNGSAAEIATLVEKVALGVQPDHPDDIAALVASLSRSPIWRAAGETSGGRRSVTSISVSPRWTASSISARVDSVKARNRRSRSAANATSRAGTLEGSA